MSSIHATAPIRLASPVSGFSREQDARADAPPECVSAAWRKVIAQADMVAPYLQAAAIEGECGAGKYTLARYLHAHSPLSRAEFQRRDAREWLATDGDAGLPPGYLFLERVDLLAGPGQSLLLGVLKALQERPGGSTVLLGSSHSSLRQMASEGTFLPELAFRLTAIRFAVPPLRHRREDIAPLAQALLSRLCARYQLRPAILGPGALARLLQHNWPGNIRELVSVLESALLEAQNGLIQIADLALPDKPPGPIRPQLTNRDDLSLDAMIRNHVYYVLELNRGNKLRAARQLAISRSTLYRILGDESIARR